MHIPDGFLDPKMSHGLIAAALASLAFCLSKVQQEITRLAPQRVVAFAGEGMVNAGNRAKKILSKAGEKKIFLIIAVTSLIYIIQMFDFSMGNGAKGHLMGAFFASLILGPFAGTIAVSLTLLLQAFYLSDGGIIALGANIINMAFLGSFASYYFYKILNRLINMDTIHKNINIGIAAWFSVVLSASAYAIEMAVSGQSNVQDIIFIHLRIGIVEAMGTIFAFSLFRKIFNGKLNDEFRK